MILPNIPAVLLAAVRGSCLSRFSRRIESKAQRNLSSGVENTTMTTEFRPLVSEKLSFSVANLNDVQQSGCLGILCQVCCEKFLGMIFNRLGIMQKKENSCSYSMVQAEEDREQILHTRRMSIFQIQLIGESPLKRQKTYFLHRQCVKLQVGTKMINFIVSNQIILVQICRESVHYIMGQGRSNCRFLLGTKKRAKSCAFAAFVRSGS